jgi:flagellar hook-associated protein 2
MSSLPVGSSSSPLSISGLASGLNTKEIINALMGAERQPVTRLTTQSEKLTAAQQQLQSVQSSLRQLSLAASEFSLPSLFESAQSVTSSEPTRVSATTTSGAGVGGYEVEVKQLANSAQRRFTYASPAAADTIMIDGHEYKLTAGMESKALAAEINTDAQGTVYAAVVEGDIVLSNRSTGATGPEFIKVSDPGGALVEKAGTAKEGRNAEFAVDGVEGTSSSNTVTNGIPGVTLNLLGLTTTGPVTVDVQPPGPNVSAIETQIKSFVSTYNSTVEAIQKQLTTKPPEHATNAKEFATGSLFGDTELSGVLSAMRQAMYEPIEGLPAGMASPADVGISTGAAVGGGGTASQSSIQGVLKLDPTKLASAIASNPAGAEQMLQKWSQSLQKAIGTVAEPGGTMDFRITSDSSQVSELRTRIASMNELLAVREKSLQQIYAQLEGVLNKNTAQTNWLISQSESLTKSGL